LPGLVIARARPDLRVTLLDGRTERASQLQSAVGRLGLGEQVRVLAARAEEAAHTAERAAFDAVVARSFGPPPVTAECAAGFLRIGGRLVVSEPPEEAPAGRWPVGPLAELGLEMTTTSAERFHYAVLRAVAACPKRYPRRTGVPRKRPLY